MEIVTSVCGKVAEKVADGVFAAAGDQLGYLFHYNDNIQKLKKQVEKLRDSRDMVQKKIESAKRNGEIIFDIVQKWLPEVDDVSAKAEKFLEDEGKANKWCLNGWCINLGQRFRFSKEAKKHTLTIFDQLQELGKFESVSYPAPPSGIILSSQIINSGIFKSRNSLKKDIMKALIDANNISIIGICGMGGIGKTTLVKEIGHHVKGAKEYDVVAMAVVSQNPSIMKIQGEIADMLGLKSLPIHSELARAGSLWERIKQGKRVLIILDDVWEIIKLSEIGIPFGNDHRGCKILITSRNKDVCIGMDCQQIYNVETLSKQESWELFSKIAGSIVENSDINQIAREVTISCGGLPLAIVTTAGALKGKSIHGWKRAARRLESSTPEMEKKVFSSLKLSLDYLEEETKSLFLSCGLFPEDYEIPIEDLVRYWIGLKWFGDIDETIEDVRNKVYDIVSTLTSSFLLIEGYEGHVQMHDIVRDFAITIAPEYNHKFMVNAGIGLKEWPRRDTFKDFTCISLMANYIEELPNGLECPNLQALLLQKNQISVVPSSFFEKMTNLKVLNLGQIYIEALPDSLLFLTNLRTLEVSASKVVDLSIIGRLSKLEILSISDSILVKEIPSSFSQLTNLMLLDLTNTNLELIPYGIISSLQKLEELHINGNWNLVELCNGETPTQCFCKLRVLKVSWCRDLLNIAPSHLLQGLQNLQTLEVNWCKSLVYIFDCEKIKITKGETKLLSSLEYLNLSDLFEMSHMWKGDHQSISLHNLKSIKLFHCSKLIKLFSPTLLQSLICLEELDIENCYYLREIFEKKEAEDVELDHTITSPCLGNLTSINIYTCDSLEILFTPSIAKLLVKLKSLKLSFCSRIQEIITNEKGEKEKSSESIVFPRLEELNLFYLHSLTCFSSGSYTIEFPKLERLKISGCGKMKTFSFGEQVTPNLKEVRLDGTRRWNGNVNTTFEEYFNEQVYTTL
ncbi:probable disease resistance protein At4g27220 [Mangifera indica]|uniref:probable disease resistance protein At4g27220 n=1 Tax=Mangifera indica TaxID=29780 RepID=UPI001CFC434C|nr:probable disease resistance protein At4g27220 [Mangifera indica]